MSKLKEDLQTEIATSLSAESVIKYMAVSINATTLRAKRP